MSAKIQVEFEVLSGELSAALEKELSKISGLLTSSNAAAAAAKKKATEDTGKHETENAGKVARDIVALKFAAEQEILKKREQFSNEAWGNEKKAATAIIAEIARLQEEKDKLVRAAKIQGADAAAKAQLAIEKQENDRQLATMRRIALENKQIAEHGAGVSVGILGIGRNIEQVYGKAGGAISKLAGPIAGAAVALGLLTASQSESITQTATMGASLLPMIGMVHQFAQAEKAAAVAKGISTAAQIKLNLAFLANPVVAVVAALAALVAAFVAVYQNCETVRKAVDGLMDSFNDFIGVSDNSTRALERQYQQTRQLALEKAELARRTRDAAAGFDAESRSIDGGVEQGRKAIINIRENLRRGGILEVDADKEGNVIATRIRKFTDLELQLEKWKLERWEKELPGRVAAQKRRRHILESTDAEFGIGESPSSRGSAKKQVEENFELKNALAEAEQAHILKMQALRRQNLRGEFKDEEDYRDAQLEAERVHKSNLFHLALQYGGDVSRAMNELADTLLDIDERKHARAIAKAKEAQERMHREVEALRERYLMATNDVLDEDLHNAEVRHLKEQTDEQEHQEKIYQIKKAALERQIRMMGIMTKEGQEAQRQLRELDQQHELDSLKKKEKGWESYADQVKDLVGKLSDFLNIGKNAAKQRAEENKRYDEQISDFKGTLMEKNKLEREHQEKLKEIESEANSERVKMFATQVVPEIIKQLAMLYAASLPAATTASIASFGTAAATGTAALVAALSAFGAFREGDYTGDGNPNDPAGIVHKGEFVFTAEETEEAGLPMLRALAARLRRQKMRGYKKGGLVTDGIDKDGITVTIVSGLGGVTDGSGRYNPPPFQMTDGSGRYNPPPFQVFGGKASNDRTDEVLAELRAIRSKDTSLTVRESRLRLSGQRAARSLSRETI